MNIKIYLYLFSALLSLAILPCNAMQKSDSAGLKKSVSKKTERKRCPDNIWRAASKGNVPLVQEWIKTNPHLIHTLDKKFDEAPLHWAVKFNQNKVTRLLLDAQANPNIVDSRGKTPLHWAKSVSIVKLLLRSGASVNAQDNEGKTPLHWANNSEIVALLLRGGAAVDLRDNADRSPLYWAVGYGNEQIVAQLLEAGANINSFDKSGLTVLHSAVLSGKRSMVQYLLAQQGIEINRCDFLKQRSPLQFALRVCVGAKKKHNEQNSIKVTACIIIDLMKHGADLNLVDRKRRKPEDWIKTMRCLKHEKAVLRSALHYQSLEEGRKRALLSTIEYAE